MIFKSISWKGLFCGFQLDYCIADANYIHVHTFEIEGPLYPHFVSFQAFSCHKSKASPFYLQKRYNKFHLRLIYFIGRVFNLHCFHVLLNVKENKYLDGKVTYNERTNIYLYCIYNKERAVGMVFSRPDISDLRKRRGVCVGRF